MRRWPFILFAALLILSLGFIGVLGRIVVSDLRGLSIATQDDVSWRMSQLEVELLRLQHEAQNAAYSDGTDLSAFRKRYDIFYSRIATLQQSLFKQHLLTDAAAAELLQEAQSFLDRTTPLIDSPDVTLRANLDPIRADIAALAPSIRDLALAGVRIFTAQETDRRATFTRTLKNVGFGLVFLIALLFFALTFLIKIYRQDRAFYQSSEIARSRFEAAVSSSLDAVLVVDTSGRIVEFNGAAQTVFGYSRDEALGADMSEIIVPAHLREAHRAGMKRFIRTGEQRVIGAGRVRLEGLRKSGEVFPVELSISLSEASGETVFVSFLRDITQELKAEEDLKAALEAATVSEKAKSDLLTVMSHEMRTPLNGILGSLDLIDQSTLSPAQQRHLNSIAISGDLLLSHVNEVLDLSALASDAHKSEKTVFDLHAAVDGVADSLRANADSHGNNLSVTYLGNDLDHVIGDRTSLQRALVNLVGNAIKFTQDGDVAIEVERMPDDIVELRISDTGVGIAPENLERIFEEFVTIDTAFDRQNSGTGLGLAITKRLAEQSGGTLDADSLLGEGSLFTMRLPLPAASGSKAVDPQLADASLVSLPEGFRALVVDDNEINRAILSDVVSELGGAPVQAEDGYQAIEIAQNQTFDVLLLDISMPGIDGMETLKRLRAAGVENPPAIAVTAHASANDHATIFGADFDGLLVKPITKATVQHQLVTAFGLGSDDARSVPQDNEVHTVAEDFKSRFGEVKYLSAMAETCTDVQRLLEDLKSRDTLLPHLREEAHRISGSAAVLGETALWSALQTVQNTPEGKNPDLISAHITELKTALAASKARFETQTS